MKSTQSSVTSRALAALCFCSAALLAAPASAVQVFVPDNGFGTASVPILADYTGETPMNIIDGLGGDMINIDAVLKVPSLYVESPGGTLGGTKSGGGGGILFTWQMTGTGAFSGYSRSFNFPASTGNVLSFGDPPFDTNPASFEIHSAPRTNNAPLQSFDTDMFRMFSQISNPSAADPDFDLLRLVAGTDFGLPSPGHTTLLQTGPNWEVDSYFDLTYRIDFVGAVGGPFQGRSGSTTATVRLSLGEPIPIVPEPTTCALTAAALALLLFIRRR